MEKWNSRKPNKEEFHNPLEIEKFPKLKTISIEGIGDFEYKETYIEFPEYLVKETGGVKGYLKKQFKPYEVLKKEITEILNSHDKHYSPEGVINELLRLVTNDNFPDTTSINSLNGDYVKNHFPNAQEKIREHFIEDKMFLQEIFGDTRIGYKGHTSYGGSGTTFLVDSDKNVLKPWSQHSLIFLHKDKSDKLHNIGRSLLVEKPHKRDFRKVDKILEELNLDRKVDFEGAFNDKERGYYGNIIGNLEKVKDKNDNTALIMLGGDGLHVTNRDNTGEVGRPGTPAEGMICSGFSIKNKVFKKYLEEVEKILTTIPLNQIDEQGEALNVSLKSINYFLENKDHISDAGQHPVIPIIQGYMEIPTLRWCHASYMSIPTKKGLNILEFIT